MHTRRRLSFSIGFLVSTSTVLAAAHVRLEFPTSRYPIPAVENGSNLKQAPCGTTGDRRTTDPSRISTFRPGQVITVRFKETIDHPGHYRIAFDDDGQDAFVDPASFTDIQATPAPPILQDGITDKAGGEYQVDITLPNIECQNCTLQLIQVMTDSPPYVINTNDVYHQCADITLTSSATTTDAGTGSDGDTAGAAATSGCSCRASRSSEAGGQRSAVGLGLIGFLLRRGSRRRKS